MSEIIVKDVAAVGDPIDINGDAFFPIYLTLDGDGVPEKVRVLAKSEKKWKVGDKVLVETVQDGYEGPDGEQDWTYCRLKVPQQQKRGGGGGSSFRSSSKSTGGQSSGGSAPAQAAADRPMPTITYSEGSAAFDDFLTEASASMEAVIGNLLANFGEAKPSPDAVLRAAATLTATKANALFSAYIKSFRLAYQSAKE